MCCPCPDFDFQTSITGITTPNVSFMVRKKNNTVTLQWSPFSGTISTAGISHITINQVLDSRILPPYKIAAPIAFGYTGVSRMGYFWIDPVLTVDGIRIYLNSDSSSSGINLGDAVSFTGGSVSWIV